ncbi:MAG: hypothetical protein SGCHY_005336, partial [Lobulomycetales sp.]
MILKVLFIFLFFSVGQTLGAGSLKPTRSGFSDGEHATFKAFTEANNALEKRGLFSKLKTAAKKQVQSAKKKATKASKVVKKQVQSASKKTTKASK